MSYRFLAPIYDVVAPHFSRYRSPALVAERVQALAKPGCHLLDVGIGTGLSVEAYVDDPRFERIVGVDPSREMLAICRRKFPSVIAIEGTITAVENSKFDLVQSCGAVEHVAELSAFFAEVSRRLKRGGYFVFTYELLIPARWLQSAHAPHLGTWGRAKVYRHTPAEINAALAVADLRVCDEVEFKAYLGLRHRLVVAQRA